MKVFTLQTYAESGSANLIVPFLIGMVLFIVGIFMTRAIFSIPKILKYYKMQTVLLAKIARANGVNEAEIDKVLSVIEPSEGQVFAEDLSIRKLDIR